MSANSICCKGFFKESTSDYELHQCRHGSNWNNFNDYNDLVIFNPTQKQRSLLYFLTREITYMSPFHGREQSPFSKNTPDRSEILSLVNAKSPYSRREIGSRLEMSWGPEIGDTPQIRTIPSIMRARHRECASVVPDKDLRSKDSFMQKDSVIQLST